MMDFAKGVLVYHLTWPRKSLQFKSVTCDIVRLVNNRFGVSATLKTCTLFYYACTFCNVVAQITWESFTVSSLNVVLNVTLKLPLPGLLG